MSLHAFRSEASFQEAEAAFLESVVRQRIEIVEERKTAWTLGCLTGCYPLTTSDVVDSVVQSPVNETTSSAPSMIV